MLDERIALQHLLQVVDGLAALHHEVLTDDLEEVDRGPLAQDVPVVRDPQPHADPEIRNAEPGLRHGDHYPKLYGKWWM